MNAFEGDNACFPQDSCIGTLEKYGVGSCGPRAFYGTIGKFYVFFLN